MKATLEVQMAVAVHKVGKLIVISLHSYCTKVWANFAIYQQLAMSALKLNLS